MNSTSCLFCTGNPGVFSMKRRSTYVQLTKASINTASTGSSNKCWISLNMTRKQSGSSAVTCESDTRGLCSFAWNSSGLFKMGSDPCRVCSWCCCLAKRIRLTVRWAACCSDNCLIRAQVREAIPSATCPCMHVRQWTERKGIRRLLGDNELADGALRNSVSIYLSHPSETYIYLQIISNIGWRNRNTWWGNYRGVSVRVS